MEHAMKKSNRTGLHRMGRNGTVWDRPRNYRTGQNYTGWDGMGQNLRDGKRRYQPHHNKPDDTRPNKTRHGTKPRMNETKLNKFRAKHFFIAYSKSFVTLGVFFRR